MGGKSSSARSLVGKLGGLLDDCSDLRPDDARLICDLRDVLSELPDHLCGPPSALPPRRMFESLLSAEAFETAALRLLGNCGYMMSRGGKGEVIASVVLPHRQRESTFSASSVAAALCGALCSALHDALTIQRREDRNLLARALN